MKRVIQLVFFLLPLIMYGQYDSTRNRQIQNSYGFEWRNGKFKSTIIIPGDTPHLAQADSNAIAVVALSIYKWTGSSWQQVSGAGGSQTLQQTTDLGNTSTNDIIRISGSNYAQLTNDAGTPYVDVFHTASGGESGQLFPYRLVFGTSSFYKEINRGSGTTTRVLNLPDTGGVFAMAVKVNGTRYPAGTTGLIDLGTISGGGVAYTLINGATNLGSGSQVFKDTSSNKINLRSIVAGSGITITQNTNDITIAATGGSGTTSRTDSIGYLPESSYTENDANEQGYLWERIKINPISQWYDGISTAVYKDTIIIIGGWNASLSYDSSWHSWDGGVTWAFRCLLPQKVHTPAVIHSNDGYTYLIGGDYLNTSDERAKVFKTKDFRIYETVNSNSPFRNRVLHAGVEFNDTLYVGGGQKYTLNIVDSVYTDLWKSGDGGVTWTLVSNSLTHMGKNISGAFIVFDGRMYIVSGGQYDNTPANKTFDRAVYSTTDGLNWTNIGNIPFQGLQYPNIGVWDGRLWLAGGFHGATTSNIDSTAFMDKSGTWHVYLPPTRPTANHASSMIVYKDRLIKTLGNVTNEIWSLRRYKDKYFESTPNYSSIGVDTLKDGINGEQLFLTATNTNELRFKNSANSGAGYIKLNSNDFEIWPNGSKKYVLNPSGTWYATSILASTSSTTHYGGAYYSTSLQTTENYPGIAWSGISQRFILGLDGSQVGFRQENGGTNGIRMKYDIADGRLVINNTTVNNHDVAFTSSAMFEARSKINGMLVPRMNTTERDAISSPANALLLFNYTNNRFEFRDSINSTWAPVGVSNATTGTWTPTLTNSTNVAASTAYEFKYSRVVGTEDIYTFSGEVDIDPTTTATLTVLTFTLPVTTIVNFTYNVSGTASDDLGTSCRIAGNTSSGLAEVRFTPTDVTNRRFSVTGQFKYIAP